VISRFEGKDLGLVRPDVRLVVEKMSPVQIDIARMVRTEKTDGKLVTRYGDGPGQWFYVPEIGSFSMLTFAKNPGEFAGQANLRDPQNPSEPLLKYYFNLRGASFECYQKMAEGVAAKITRNKKYQEKKDKIYVTGIPNTGPSIGRPLARLLNRPYIDILEKTDDEKRPFLPRQNFMGEERPEEGQIALMVDDVITKKTTKVLAEDAANDGGFIVGIHAVVADRQDGGSEEMRREKKELVSALNSTQVFAVAYVDGELDDKGYDAIVGDIEKRRMERVKKRLDQRVNSRYPNFVAA
jgi:orotate phosphoribosyltransferase